MIPAPPEELGDVYIRSFCHMLGFLRKKAFQALTSLQKNPAPKISGGKIWHVFDPSFPCLKMLRCFLNLAQKMKSLYKGKGAAKESSSLQTQTTLL